MANRINFTHCEMYLLSSLTNVLQTHLPNQTPIQLCLVERKEKKLRIVLPMHNAF